MITQTKKSGKHKLNFFKLLYKHSRKSRIYLKINNSLSTTSTAKMNTDTKIGKLKIQTKKVFDWISLVDPIQNLKNLGNPNKKLN
jgi:hypothetical protein